MTETIGPKHNDDYKMAWLLFANSCRLLRGFCGRVTGGGEWEGKSARSAQKPIKYLSISLKMGRGFK